MWKGDILRAVRDSKGKLVCVLDDNQKKIVIKRKETVTIISITPNGKFKIEEQKT